MLHKLALWLLSVILLVAPVNSFCQQLDFLSGSFGTLQSVNTSSRISASPNILLPTSPCSELSTFWGFDTLGSQLIEFAFSSGSIVATGNSIPNPPGISIAICNNLNASAPSPTFYCSGFTSTYSIWSGDTNWIQNTTTSFQLYNSGGYKDYLYSLHYNGGTVQVIKFDGLNYIPIYTSTNPVACADIAVDTLGNFYLFTSLISGTQCDSLYLISPQGNILKRYPLVFNNNNAYGCFLLNDVLYVGLGKLNTDFPNTLLPISFAADSAIKGIPIPLPSGVFLNFDLASCNLFSKTSIASPDSSSLSYPTIFTPNNDGNNDAFKAIEKNIVTLNCKVYNRWGTLVSELKEVNSTWDGRTISGVELSDGIYYYLATGLGKDEKQYELRGFVMLIR